MSGIQGRGGQNRIEIAEHLRRGSYRPARHATGTRAASEALGAAARRAALKGLTGESRKLAASLLGSFGNWDAASLQTLRFYVQSCARLAALEQGDGQDTKVLHREILRNVALLKALNLESGR
jgi:hypothetical protein